MLDTVETIRRHVIEDIRTAREKDPATTSALEVLLLYPGIHAVWLYRIAHVLWEGDHPIAARALSELTRLITGVEIHPAATIGRRLFINHGNGVVIGQTSEIGDDVLIYHGVTLGSNTMRREKRHPTVEDGVTLCAKATIIGAITIGRGATVGAGSVVLRDVPEGETVAGVPAESIGDDEIGDDETTDSKSKSRLRRVAELTVAVAVGLVGFFAFRTFRSRHKNAQTDETG